MMDVNRIVGIIEYIEQQIIIKIARQFLIDFFSTRNLIFFLRKIHENFTFTCYAEIY